MTSSTAGLYLWPPLELITPSPTRGHGLVRHTEIGGDEGLDSDGIVGGYGRDAGYKLLDDYVLGCPPPIGPGPTWPA